MCFIATLFPHCISPFSFKSIIQNCPLNSLLLLNLLAWTWIWYPWLMWKGPQYNRRQTNQEKAANNSHNKRTVAMLRILVREANNLSEMARTLNNEGFTTSRDGKSTAKKVSILINRYQLKWKKTAIMIWTPKVLCPTFGVHFHHGRFPPLLMKKEPQKCGFFVKN